MFKQIGDLKVSYDVQGSGSPLILIHGGGARAQSFEEMVPHLKKEYKVFTCDLRGFGETVRMTKEPLSYDLWDQDLVGFVENLEIKRAVIVGWSMGGMIAMNFALRHPQMISHLILMGCGSARVPSGDRSGFDLRRKLIESGASQGEIVEKTFEFTKKAFSPHSLDNNPHAVEKVRQEHLRNDPASYLEMLNASRPKIGDQLGNIKCPTLILVGDADGRAPLPMSEDLNKAMPNSFLKIIPNCGHFYGYEQPEATSRAMITFLNAFGAK